MYMFTVLLALEAGADPPPSATLMAGSSLAESEERFEQKRLLVEPADPPTAGVPWVARFGSGTAMDTPQLLRALHDPALALQFRRRQRGSTAFGTAGLVVGTAGLFVGSSLLLGSVLGCVSLSCSTGSSSSSVGVVGAGLTVGGLVLDGFAIRSFGGQMRRAKHPAAWLDRADVERRVVEHNAALAAELGLEAAP